MRLPAWLRRDDGADVGAFRRQLVVMTGVLGALVALALVAVVQVVLAGSSTEAVDRVLRDRANAVISSVRTKDGRLDVPAARLEPGVAVYDQPGPPVAGTVPPSMADTFARLSRSTGSDRTSDGETYRVLARPFTTPGGARGVTVLAEPLAPYENDEHIALAVSLAAGALIVLLAMALTAWATHRVLRPVAEMARVAEQWSHRDLEERFDLGEPTNEIRALGHTLDGLLDRVALAILAEQRLTSELAHELRSPLTAIATNAELIEMRTDLDDQLREDVRAIRSSCRQMSATITGLLDLARGQASTARDSRADLATVADQIRRDGDLAGVVRIDLPADARVDASTDLVRRAIEPVVMNAVRFADHVRITAVLDGSVTRVLVSDDGPGVSPEAAPHVFEPGHTTGGGSGLGLALARRVARSIGGDVTLTSPSDVATPGAVFEISLPTI